MTWSNVAGRHHHKRGKNMKRAKRICPWSSQSSVYHECTHLGRKAQARALLHLRQGIWDKKHRHPWSAVCQQVWSAAAALTCVRPISISTRTWLICYRGNKLRISRFDEIGMLWQRLKTPRSFCCAFTVLNASPFPSARKQTHRKSHLSHLQQFRPCHDWSSPCPSLKPRSWQLVCGGKKCRSAANLRGAGHGGLSRLRKNIFRARQAWRPPSRMHGSKVRTSSHPSSPPHAVHHRRWC